MRFGSVTLTLPPLCSQRNGAGSASWRWWDRRLQANATWPISSRAAVARMHDLPIEATTRDLESQPLTPSELGRFDGMVLDPPRTGVRPSCEALDGSTVGTIVYVSWHPGSFARDARTLADGGYMLERVWPIDQFLWSHHLELVVHFVRR